MAATRIVIEMRDSGIQAVWADGDVKIEMLDWDDIEDEAIEDPEILHVAREKYGIIISELEQVY